MRTMSQQKRDYYEVLGIDKTADPATIKKAYRKLAQRMFFFWYKSEERRAIINELKKIGRSDLIDKLYGR